MATSKKNLTPVLPDSTANGSAQLSTGSVPSDTMARRLWAYRSFWALLLVIVTLDQVTKHWIEGRMPLGSKGASGITVVPGFFYLIHVGNPGAAWSMFTGQSTALAVLAVGTLIAIFIWRHQLGLRQPFAKVCFGLLCGGILGNLFDRVTHGYVVDFIDLHFGSYPYPTFNVADSAICVGVFSYVVWSLKQPAQAGR